MSTELLERAPEAKLLTDGGGMPPETPPLTAAPAENPNGDYRTQADYDATFRHMAEQYDVDATLGEIAEHEGIAGPGFKDEADQELGSTALKNSTIQAAFDKIVATQPMKNLDTKADSDIKEWNNPTDTGIAYDQSADLSDVDAVGTSLTEQHEIAQADGWKPELLVVENRKDDGGDTPESTPFNT